MSKQSIILFVGDICIDHKHYIISRDLQKFFQQDCIGIANLEAPIIASNSFIEPRPKAGPQIKQNKAVIQFLRRLNINYVSGANNHMMDYGEFGLKATQQELLKAKIILSGCGSNLNKARMPLLINNTNIVVICTCEEEFGIAESDVPGCYSMYKQSIIDQIRNLKKKKHLVIIFPHGGSEMTVLPTQYIINRYHEFIDAGADLVVGHHPHIPQGIELYHHKLIIYSLGNFIHFFYPKQWGIMLKVKIADDTIIKHQIIPIKLNNNELTLVAKPDNYLVYINEVSALLYNQSLRTSIQQEQAIYMYKTFYRSYFTGLFQDNSSILRNVIRTITQSRQQRIKQQNSELENQELLLLHLYRNNSHKENIETALKLHNQETHDYRTQQSHQLFTRLNNFINHE